MTKDEEEGEARKLKIGEIQFEWFACLKENLKTIYCSVNNQLGAKDMNILILIHHFRLLSFHFLCFY